VNSEETTFGGRRESQFNSFTIHKVQNLKFKVNKMNPETEFREGLDELAEHYTEVLKLLGEDPEREGLVKTPMRVAKAMQILTRGYTQDAHKVLTDALFEEKYNQMVIVKDIDFFSMCEHHMLPFYGKVHVAYIPNGKITGLSAQTGNLAVRDISYMHLAIERKHVVLAHREEINIFHDDHLVVFLFEEGIGQYLVCILCIATSQYLHSLGYSHRCFYKSFTFRVFSQEL
jgi:hypothetical protein